MPYNQNDPNFQTKNSKVLNFNDFFSNVGKEKEELKKVDRSIIANSTDVRQLPGGRKHKYNRVTHKIDDLSKAEIKDKIQAIEDMGIKEPKHKYKIVEENTMSGIYTKDNMFDAFVAGDTESMRTGDDVDKEEFDDWFNEWESKY